MNDNNCQLNYVMIVLSVILLYIILVYHQIILLKKNDIMVSTPIFHEYHPHKSAKVDIAPL